MRFSIPRSNQAVLDTTRMLLLRTRPAVTTLDKPIKECDSHYTKGKKTYILTIDHISFQHPDSLITGREIRVLSNMPNTAEIWLKGQAHEPDLRIGDGDIVALDTEGTERFFSIAKASARG